MGLRDWFGAILAHNHNQQGALQRALVAKANDLPADHYATPCPGANVTTTTTTTNQNAGGWLKGALLGAALLTGGGVGVLGLMQALPKAAPASVPVVPPAPAPTPPAPEAKKPDATARHYGKIRWRIVDGHYTEDPVVPLELP